MTGRGGLGQFWKHWLCDSLLHQLSAHTAIACVPSEECNGGRRLVCRSEIQNLVANRFNTWGNRSRDELLHGPCRRNRANQSMPFLDDRTWACRVPEETRWLPTTSASVMPSFELAVMTLASPAVGIRSWRRNQRLEEIFGQCCKKTAAIEVINRDRHENAVHPLGHAHNSTPPTQGEEVTF